MITLFSIAIQEKNKCYYCGPTPVFRVCVYLGEAGLVVQYAEDTVWPGADEFQTRMEVLNWHGIPLDLLSTVFLLQDTHKHTNTCTLLY